MRITCTYHARVRLAERFGVSWSAALEEDIRQQLLASEGPISSADDRGREESGSTYWAVKIDGARAVIVLSSELAITTVLRRLDAPGRPKRQARRGARGFRFRGRTGKRPPPEPEPDDRS